MGGEISKKKKIEDQQVYFSPNEKEEKGVVHQPSSSNADWNHPKELSNSAEID